MHYGRTRNYPLHVLPKTWLWMNPFCQAHLPCRMSNKELLTPPFRPRIRGMMKNVIRSLHFVSIAAMTCIWVPATAGDGRAVYNSTAEINASVVKTADGSAAQLLKTDPSTPVYVIRRDGPGKVEVHRKL